MVYSDNLLIFVIMSSLHTREYHILIRLLYSLRVNAGITQTDLAKKIGVPQSYLSKIENEERRVDVIELCKICNALDIDIEYSIKELKQQLNEG